LGDYTNANSFLGIINSEYSQRINLAATMLKTINSSSAGIESNIQPIKSSLSTAQSTIGDLQKTIEGMDKGFVSPMVSFVIINNIARHNSKTRISWNERYFLRNYCFKCSQFG
jgi:hypothetical protein